MGGAERVLLTLLRELRRDWKLAVIAGSDGPLVDAVRDLGCAIEVLPMPPDLMALGDWGGVSLRDIVRALPSVLRYRAALRHGLRTLSPEIVQTNGFKMHVLGALACPGSSRLIWHIHDFVRNRRAMKTLLRWCSRKPSDVVAISPAVAEDFSVIRKARIIWNSVDLARFSPTAAKVHPETRIGLVATFARWKGQDVFLQALSRVSKDLPWRAWIVGGNIYKRAGSQWTEEELRAIAKRLDLESRVEFTGFLADPAPVVRTLDIVVHASTEPEPFGLVIAEAMAAARAVVTTSDSLVTHEVNGLVCRRNDPADLAQAIERLAQDPALRERLGQAAATSAAEKFRPERMAKEFITLYESSSH